MVFALLGAKKKRSPNRRWILTTMAGNGSVNLLQFHRGFRNGDGSGAFFFALITPSCLNGYAVHASAQRVGAAKIPPKLIDSFGKAPTGIVVCQLRSQQHECTPISRALRTELA